jgi:hypothetical protein
MRSDAVVKLSQAFPVLHLHCKQYRYTVNNTGDKKIPAPEYVECSNVCKNVRYRWKQVIGN